MKKKRLEIQRIGRSNADGSSIGLNGTSSGIDSGIGYIGGSIGSFGSFGSMGSSSGASSGSSNGPRDCHHNTSTPCCNLTRDIAWEIFPSLAVATSDSGDVNTKGGDKTVAEEEDSGKKAEVGIKKLKRGESNGKSIKNSNSGTGDSSTQQKQQPLLGFMIQNYLIEERKRIRSEQGVVGDNNENGGCKKKKKKKRKKKGGQTQGDAVASSPEDVKEEEEDDDKGVNEEVTDYSLSSLPAADTAAASDCTTGDAATTISTVASNSGKENAPPVANFTESNGTRLFNSGENKKKLLDPQHSVTSHQNQSQNPSQNNCRVDTDETITAPPSELDQFLDSLIDRPNSPSSISNGGTKVDKRDIESFVTYLKEKFESHLQQQQQLHQQRQSKNKEKTKEFTNASTGISELSPSSSSLSPPCNFMGMKDVLPTISINEVHKHVSDADCRVCRTSAVNHLRVLSGIHPKSSKNGEGFKHSSSKKKGGTNGKKPSLSGNNQINQSRSLTGSGGVIVLDNESVKIKMDSNTRDTRSSGGRLQGLLIPVSSGYCEDFDHAFDYMAFEDVEESNENLDIDLEAARENLIDEETSKENSKNSFRLELYPLCHDSDGEHFLQIIASPGSMEGKIEYPMNSLAIIDLIKGIILPCGMENASSRETGRGLSLKTEEFSKISNNALEHLSAVKTKFLRVSDMMRQTNEEYKKAEESSAGNVRTHFDTKSSKFLLNCDKQCEQTLNLMGDLLLHVTKMSCFVGWPKEYGPFLMRTLVETWEQFDSTLDNLVEPTLRHRGKVLQIAGRPGVVPQLYLDASIRRSFQELVRIKVSELDKLHDYLKKTLLEPGHKNYISHRKDAPTPLVRLSIIGAYLAHVSSPGASMEKVFPNADSEDQFKLLLSSRIRLSQKTILGAQTTNITQEEEENKNVVQDLHDKILKSVMPQIDLLLENSSQPEFLRNNYYDFVKRSEISLDSLERGCKHSPTSPASQALDTVSVECTRKLLNKSGSLSTKWIYFLAMRQYEESSFKAFSLPQQLKTWLESISGSNLDSFNMGLLENTDNKAECQGSSGERRVSSVLAALLYRWFEERCLEWHAELIREELLQSMDMDLPKEERESKSKAVKKKKSKRKSGGDRAKRKEDEVVSQNDLRKGLSETKETSSQIENNDGHASPVNITTPSESSLIEQRPLHPAYPTESDQGTVFLESSAGEIGEENPRDHMLRETNGDLVNREKQTPPVGNIEGSMKHKSNTGTDMHLFGHDEAIKFHSTNGSNPKVGITDGKHFVSAESFLVDRIETILVMVESEKCRTKKFQIVQL